LATAAPTPVIPISPILLYTRFSSNTAAAWACLCIRCSQMPRIAVRPYLIAHDQEGVVCITVHTTRFNSQGYRLVTTKLIDGDFPSLASARTYVRTEFPAEATDIATA
jgi:hypothetical protein